MIQYKTIEIMIVRFQVILLNVVEQLLSKKGWHLTSIEVALRTGQKWPE